MEVEDDDAKIDVEDTAYHAMHVELFEKYAGQYVAIHKGRLVDLIQTKWRSIFALTSDFPDEVVR